MIKPVTMYSAICDRCGKTFIDEFTVLERHSYERRNRQFDKE